MKKITISMMLALVAATPTMMPTAAYAQDYRWNGDRNGNWDPSRSYRTDRRYERQQRRLAREDRIYRGGDGRYYCRRNNGTTGLVIGAIGGGLLGGAIGGDTLGALVGAGAGGLLGRSVDRGQVRCR